MACITQFLTSGVRSVSAVLIQIGKDVEESAWMSGATRLTTIRKILLPLLLPGMQSAWILLFVLFFRELSAVILLWSSQTITLPILSYEVWREGSYPRLAALGMVETALIALVVLVAQVIGGLLQYSSGGSRAKAAQTRAVEGRPVPSGA
jgi:iron(III) transport system permease protein